ncbi:group III truncated hemoglobin [Microvirga puerhi]|uniref:Group III truncated hemoglobin n=1 Tax=Microvirga puerhi TaxID=2876078 RepID=A0ABS7VM20_9HYPH|nr:group III truncated hemoglobin [Microvirga puerhi]MBZ6076057.1 group III truncated hemoglobin [Microvirga puerhi]
MTSRRIPLVEPKANISESLIETLVRTFYGRVLEDETLGPIFREVIGNRWDEHLATMVDFWSSIVRSTGRYSGKPHLAHQDLGLDLAHFDLWLNLFETTARDVCPPDAAELFIDRAHRIADSLQIGLDIGPKALRLPKKAGSGPSSA